MKKGVFLSVAVLLTAIFVFLLTGCKNNIKGNLLAAPAESPEFGYSDAKEEGFISMNASAEAFGAKFAAEAYSAYKGEGNFTVSPISVYMALALAAESADGNTREELLQALGVTRENLLNDFGKLYSSVMREYTGGMSEVTNSVWLDSAVNFDRNTLDVLANKYYCYSYSADFKGDNEKANIAIKNFVKERTRKLIDIDFNFDTSTAFVLLNTLYLKDVWNTLGKDLEITGDKYSFDTGSGTVNKNFLRGYYSGGRAYESEVYRSFYSATANGYKLKFIVPKDGHSLAEAFTAENIAEAGSNKDYNAVDDINKIRYFTRCVFPEFNGSYDADVADVLGSGFGIRDLFDARACDLGTLVPGGGLYCAELRHVTELKVDRKGIEGAAVTVVPGNMSADPGEYKEVYEDFVVDRAFGFVILDPYGTTLFAGTVRTI